MSKKCSKCGDVKESEEFAKRSSAKDGLDSQCKGCHKLYRDNADAKKKQGLRNKAWRRNNPEKVAECQRKWRENNADKRREQLKRSHRRKMLAEAELSDKHTYLVSDGEFIKIGVFTKGQLEGRLSSLQTGNPRKLTALATSSSNIEKLCHYEFEHLNVLNEWFKLDLEIITFFTENAE